jgi:ElaB/YqjD/DUF883 family membrane-anchored ribosome-binding protein
MTVAVTPEYQDIRIEPPLDEWSAMLATAGDPELRSSMAALRRSARNRLVNAAQQFVLRLQQMAVDAGLSPTTAPLLTGDPDAQQIVMTGHQPVLFHSGLTFKYDTTERFASDQGALGIAVVIDTDEGDAGAFAFPAADNDFQSSHEQVRTEHGGTEHNSTVAGLSCRLKHETISRGSSIYCDGVLKDADQIRAIGEQVEQSLQKLGQPEAAALTRSRLEGFARLSTVGASLMEASLIMRWQHGIGGQLLELPLSAIASFPEVLSLTADILRQARRFASAYNQALDAYREEQGIRNAANPFPNLEISEEQFELPFWVVDHNSGSRSILVVSVSGNETQLLADGQLIDSFTDDISTESLEPLLLQNQQIIPRGALITAFLRLLFADLFIHGTGGGKYDRFTDEFIRSWWNAGPTGFAVASASRYLFAEQRQELRQLEMLSADLRDLQYNPQRYFGSNTFSAELEAALKQLIDEKQSVINEMKSAHGAGQSAKDLGRRIQQISDDIKSRVEAEFRTRLQPLSSLTSETREAIDCRTYPWFFFA